MLLRLAARVKRRACPGSSVEEFDCSEAINMTRSFVSEMICFILPGPRNTHSPLEGLALKRSSHKNQQEGGKEGKREGFEGKGSENV